MLGQDDRRLEGSDRAYVGQHEFHCCGALAAAEQPPGLPTGQATGHWHMLRRRHVSCAQKRPHKHATASSKYSRIPQQMMASQVLPHVRPPFPRLIYCRKCSLSAAVGTWKHPSKPLSAPHTLFVINHSVTRAMGAQQIVPPASPARVWVIIGASRGIGEEYVAQVGLMSRDLRVPCSDSCADDQALFHDGKTLHGPKPKRWCFLWRQAPFLRCFATSTACSDQLHPASALHCITAATPLRADLLSPGDLCPSLGRCSSRAMPWSRRRGARSNHRVSQS